LSREFGRGFAEQSLRAMRQFFLTYPNRNAVRSDLGWAHYRTLMRLPDDQRDFYAHLAVTGRWSSRELERQINSMLYERAALSRRPEELTGSLPQPNRPATTYDDAFRDPYVLDFLGLTGAFSEKDLEAALVQNIEKFLLELGIDFCFVGRQKRLSIGDDDFYVDLVFFHRRLRCTVLVDLKVGRFEPADAAQMKLYLNWFHEYDKRPGEDDPIGLILCGSKNEQVIELLLANPETSVDERIKVAQYLLLDSQNAIRERLAQVSAVYDQVHEL
jgi:predicted nuclease of restriction endonuclease-like (RecB) superfamily